MQVLTDPVEVLEQRMGHSAIATDGIEQCRPTEKVSNRETAPPTAIDESNIPPDSDPGWTLDVTSSVSVASHPTNPSTGATVQMPAARIELIWRPE